MRKLKHIVLHHSASPRDTTTIGMIKRWHMEERGWDHLGYHRIITGNGKIARTLTVEKEGYGVYGKNADSIHICVTGDFTKETPTKTQLDSLEKLCTKLCKKFHVEASSIIGHNKLALPEHPTLCPGKNLESEIGVLIAKVCSDVAQRTLREVREEATMLSNIHKTRLELIVEALRRILAGIIKKIKKLFKRGVD